MQAVDASSGSGRRCTNCGGEHNISDCKKPIVDSAERPCWVCHKSGHIGIQCPMKQPPAVLKAINEEAGSRPRAILAVGDDEHDVDRRGFVVATKDSRPRATNVTMGMHLANAFAPLSCAVNGTTGVRRALAVRADEAIPAENQRQVVAGIPGLFGAFRDHTPPARRRTSRRFRKTSRRSWMKLSAS